MGLITPPSTWYRPRYSPMLSKARGRGRLPPRTPWPHRGADWRKCCRRHLPWDCGRQSKASRPRASRSWLLRSPRTRSSSRASMFNTRRSAVRRPTPWQRGHLVHCGFNQSRRNLHPARRYAKGQVEGAHSARTFDGMTPNTVLLIALAYVAVLLGIAHGRASAVPTPIPRRGFSWPASKRLGTWSRSEWWAPLSRG